MLSRKSGLIVTMPLAAMGLPARSSFGQALPLNDWTNASGDSQWNNPANWTAGLPTSAQEARIAIYPYQTITVPDDAIAGEVQVSGATLVGGTISTAFVEASDTLNATYLGKFQPLPGSSLI